MSPTEIRAATLAQLRAARVEMMSFEWLAQLENEPQATKSAAARTLMRTQHAILQLENQTLADIRDKLIANESELAAGIDNVKRALKTIQNIKLVLEVVGALLKVVAKVVTLI